MNDNGKGPAEREAALFTAIARAALSASIPGSGVWDPQITPQLLELHGHRINTMPIVLEFVIAAVTFARMSGIPDVKLRAMLENCLTGDGGGFAPDMSREAVLLAAMADDDPRRRDTFALIDASEGGDGH